MEFPLSVLQGLKAKKVEQASQLQVQPASSPGWTSDQHIKDEHCPIGCDPARTTLAISKSGRKDKGNFVQVYYRGSGKIPKVVPLAVKQEMFWREFNELEERNARSRRNRSQPDRRTNQSHPGSLFA